MAPKFTRRRWRRPERLTLEGPAPTRRKDLVVPDVLILEHGPAWRENRQRMATLLIGFLVLSALDGLAIGALFGGAWIGLPAGLLLGLAYLVAGARFGDGWMHHVLAAHEANWPRAENMVEGLARRMDIPPPRLHVVAGEAPNAIALGLRRRWLALTESCRSLERLELEALVSHELAHIRDGDGALAAAYVLIAGAPELGLKALRASGGVLAWLALPLWPACLVVRLVALRVYPSDREHRADVIGALLTRYPPGMKDLLNRAAVEHETSALRATDPFWFAPRTGGWQHPIARRAELVAEM